MKNYSIILSLVLSVSIMHPIGLDGIRYLRQKNVYSNGITILLAGSYALAEDITAAITISVDNVLLNLAGHKLTNASGDAITISGRNNVQVRDGIVSASSGAGVSVASSSSQICIEHVTARSCIEGVSCDSSSQVTVKNCDLSLSSTGITIQDSTEVEVKSTTASRNTYAGFSLVSSDRTLLSDCRAVYTGFGSTSSSLNVYGFVSSDGTGNVFESCIAQGTLALALTGVANVATGFAFLGTENLSKIINCETDVVQTSNSGFAMPHGILLQSTFDTLVSVTGTSGSVTSLGVSWSPNGAYLATAGVAVDGHEIQIFLFDRSAGTITKTDGASQGATGRAVAWSPDGAYLATAGDTEGSYDEIQIFSVDQSRGLITTVTGASQGTEAYAVDWSPDGTYLATGGSTEGSDDEIQIFSFDRATGTLTKTDGASQGAQASAVAWSPDGEYLATGGFPEGGSGGNAVQIFSFDFATGTVTTVTGAPHGDDFPANDDCWSVDWSPDGIYLATGGNRVQTNGDNEVQIFSFDRTAGLLTTVTGIDQGLDFDDESFSVKWAPYGDYLASGGDRSPGFIPSVQIFLFDRFAGTISRVDVLQPLDIGYSVDWAPDGAYFAAGGVQAFFPDSLEVFQALVFPSSNVIKNNIAHGASGRSSFASGVGISGSDIENFILGNNAYNNKTFNYLFVTDIYDQRFDTAPNLLQNISRRAQNPIYRP